MKTQFKTFQIWHSNKFGIACEKVRAIDFESAIKKASGIAKKTWFEVVDESDIDGNTLTRSDSEEKIDFELI